MLSVNSYPAEYVATCRDAVRRRGLTGDKSIKYRADGSVLGLKPGDPVTLDVAAFRRLADAFFTEIERRFPAG